MKVWPILVIASSAAPLGAFGCAEAPELSSSEISAIAEDAFVYGYPLVLMGVTENRMTAGGSRFSAPLNRFRHLDSFPTPEDRTVIRPNTDTLYSSAWLDLTAEPLVVRVPDTQGRYYVMQMMDAWTNVFAAPGTRTTGNAEHAFALVGPGWSGSLPHGVIPVRAPTNTVWILGRTQTHGADDVPAVRALQAQYTITKLGAFARHDTTAAQANVPEPVTGPPVEPPPVTVDRMHGLGFLRALTTLMQKNPAPRRDAPMLERLSEIGFTPGEPFLPTPEVASVLDAAKRRAEQRMISAAMHIGTNENGWRVVLRGIGDYGAHYDARAAVAKVGLGANLPEDAVYPTTFTDSAKRLLTGERRYVIHFAPGQAPPVNAFWSLTLYDKAGYLVENPIHRYAIHDRDPLQYNADGSLDLYIQSESPGEERKSNWLPAPAGDMFSLTMRLYWPRPAVLQGEWKPPAVKAVE